jgi:transcriptional antiterminator RfaH
MPDRSPERLLQPGQAVRMIDGPLKGLEGIYQQADGELRAMVLVDLLSKQHSILVDSQHVFPVTN